jgi:hypothetical protein
MANEERFAPCGIQINLNTLIIKVLKLQNATEAQPLGQRSHNKAILEETVQDGLQELLLNSLPQRHPLPALQGILKDCQS